MNLKAIFETKVIFHFQRHSSVARRPIPKEKDLVRIQREFQFLKVYRSIQIYEREIYIYIELGDIRILERRLQLLLEVTSSSCTYIRILKLSRDENKSDVSNFAKIVRVFLGNMLHA